MPLSPLGVRLLKIALASAFVVSVVAYWGGRAAYEWSNSRWRADRASIASPYPVGGLRIPLQRFVSTSAEVSGRRLLLVGSDTCRFTEAAIPKWQELIAALPFGPTDGVTVVAFGERTIAAVRRAAETRRVPLEVVQLVDPTLWTMTTGMSSTPITAVLDPDQRLVSVGYGEREIRLELVREMFVSR